MKPDNALQRLQPVARTCCCFPDLDLLPRCPIDRSPDSITVSTMRMSMVAASTSHHTTSEGDPSTRLRALTEFSLNLSRLDLTNEMLQESLQAKWAEEAQVDEKNAIEAALLLCRANAALRLQLAKDYENMRLRLISEAVSPIDAGLSARVENAFQMDWFSTAAAKSTDLDDIIPLILQGEPVNQRAKKWSFDKIQTDDIVEALHLSLKATKSTSSKIIGKISNTLQIDIPGPQLSNESSENVPEHDYGFPEIPSEYLFDHEPESAIVIVPATPTCMNDQIKCGTLYKLVERLTDDRTQDLNLRYVFLLTYHSFTTAHAVLDALVQRYFIPHPPNTTPTEIEYFEKTRKKGIRLKVFSVLKKWVEDHYSDFEHDDRLREDLEMLLSSRLADASWSCKLSKTILSVMAKQSSGGVRLTSVTFTHMNPQSEFRLKTTLPELEANFMETSALEIARQMALMDFELFRRIQPRECLNQAWSKKSSRDVNAANIMNMIRRFVLVSQWAQWMILNGSSSPSIALQKMISIGEHCLILNDFSSACAMFSGLECTPVHRLRKVWNQLPCKSQKSFETLASVFRSDNKSRMRFRQILQEAIPPCIPHLGLFLGDLTFIDDGNPSELNGMINFQKRRKLSERIMWIKQYQQAGYQLTCQSVLHDYFYKHLVTRTESELWDLSEKIQP